VPELPAEPSTGNGLVSKSNPVLVTKQADLVALLGRLRQAGEFAYDSEFIGEETYTPVLCLVQIATTTEVALVDPLSSEIDLGPFWELLCDEGVVKIVHAGQQDVEPVVRLTGDRPRGVFDTQLAAGFVGLTYPVSLAKLASELVGARLAKSMTFTQWDARPLTATQLRYAADDVRYLPAMRAELMSRLRATGNVARAESEFEALCQPEQYRFDPNTYIYRVRGSGSLSPNQARVLRELVVWRDGAARRADVPARTLVRDDVLIDLSRQPVKSLDKLGRTRGLPRPVEAQHGQQIVEATLRGLAAGPVPGFAQEKGDDPTPSHKFIADVFWSAVQSLCHAHGIDPALATSRGDVGKLVFCHLTGRAVPEDLRLMSGWRRELLTDPLLKMLDGEADLRIHWHAGQARVDR
jgi:ribonuclease D